MHKLQNKKFKIKDEEHSRQIQECLLKLGYCWANGCTEVSYLESLYIYCYDERFMTHSSIDTAYREHENTEQTLEYLQQEVAKLGTSSIESQVITPVEDSTTNSQCVTYGQLISQAHKANMSVHFYPDSEVQLWDADTETDKSFKTLDAAMKLVEAKLNWMGAMQND
jgi:hypothetical protein